MTYSDTRQQVPDWYWADDCPCAIAGEYQKDCPTCPDWDAIGQGCEHPGTVSTSTT